MPINTYFVNFQYGEIDPLATARYDLPLGPAGLELVRNYIVEPQGALRFRNGTEFVYHTRLNQKAVLIPFQFSDQQSYLIEATPERFRFYKDNAIITEAPVAITGVTKASVAVVTQAAHGYNNGDEVVLENIVGMTELNGRSVLVANKTTNTYEITDIFGVPINSTSFTTYVSGGSAARVYEITTPYLAADLEALQFTQNADTMYLTHNLYAPRKLTRAGHTSWTLATYVRTSDPFTAAGKYPRSTCFLDTGRIMMGYTDESPETIFSSRAPSSSGVVRYDDFTLGTNPDDAVKFTLAPIQGKVDSIQWITNTDKFVVVGTFGSVRRVFGSSIDSPIGPGSVTAKPVNAVGAAPALPASTGTVVFYIRRDRKQVRSIEYDFALDGYRSVNRNIGAGHLGRPGLKQLVFQSSTPNVLWVVRDDGVLIGYTYEEQEQKAGWHQHQLGGEGKVLWAGVMPRASAEEQLWVVVERVINGVTRRSVEYLADQQVFPTFNDFYTPATDLVAEGDRRAIEAADRERYNNVLYERTKHSCHLDMALKYDGSTIGLDAGANLSLTDTEGDITITSSAAVFTSSMVGREIWKKYDSTGVGGGRAVITSFVSSTEVEATTTVNFDNADDIPAGEWYLTTATIQGLTAFEGATFFVMADGSPQGESTVASGRVNLEDQASVVFVGFKYRGLLRSTTIEAGGIFGPAQSKVQRVSKIAVRFLVALGTAIGSDQYRLTNLLFKSTADKGSRPSPLYTGFKQDIIADSWEVGKRFFIAQETPNPCIILGVDVTGETADDR